MTRTGAVSRSAGNRPLRHLITGGAGFIGSHLAEALIARGDEVIAIDDLSTGRLENIEHLQSDPRFRTVVDTCANVQVMGELIATSDRVYHLAAAVGVKLIVESPVRTIETNVHLTEVVLKLAAAHRRPVLIASSSEVYGKSTAFPFHEDADLVLGPTSKGRWSYACSKAIDEFLGLAYWKEKGSPVVIARLFNTVGPRQTGRHGMVIPRLVQQALSGDPLTVFGDGKQARCFAHVVDVVGALVSLLDADTLYGQVFNVGSTRETTILDLAHRVRELTRSRSEIVLVPYDQAYEQGFEDVARRVPDISRIRQAIGWEPARSLTAILEDAIAYATKS